MSHEKILSLLLVATLLFMSACKPKFPEAKKVSEIPQGFVILPKSTDEIGGGLYYTFFEACVVILDKDNNTIYQTLLDNSDFIVRYKDNYYVNEEKLSEIRLSYFSNYLIDESETNVYQLAYDHASEIRLINEDKSLDTPAIFVNGEAITKARIEEIKVTIKYYNSTTLKKGIEKIIRDVVVLSEAKRLNITP